MSFRLVESIASGLTGRFQELSHGAFGPIGVVCDMMPPLSSECEFQKRYRPATSMLEVSFFALGLLVHPGSGLDRVGQVPPGFGVFPFLTHRPIESKNAVSVFVGSLPSQVSPNHARSLSRVPVHETNR